MLPVSFLLDKYGWEAIDELDNWVYVFDKLPPRMKLIVDFKMQGLGNSEIANTLAVSERTVRYHLLQAKMRFLRGENLI